MSLRKQLMYCSHACRVLQHTRSFHVTPSRSFRVTPSRPRSFMDWMLGIGEFNVVIIMPDDKNKLFTFADVGGHAEPKEELEEIVDFLRKRDKYTNLGAKIPSGALLSGPPGNGKTLLARAIAGEASVPFLSVAGPQFIEKIGGLGAKRMRSLFEQARNLAPCILFIDEFDAIGKKRSSVAGGTGGDSEYQGTVNQLLVEMDGLKSREDVFVICATNMEEVLDKALIRPGRLDRKIHIGSPTEDDRVDIFMIYVSKLKVSIGSKAKYCIRLAECTPGYSGAQIANICNEAAIQAARYAKTSVTEQDFEDALERITVGLERKNQSVLPEEQKLSAYYEAGQVLLAWLLPTLTPALKISIKSRVGKPLGFTRFAPRKELLASKEHLLDIICRGLAGKASQAAFFNKNTDQAKTDLEQITDVAYSLIADHGMGKCAPNMSFHEVRQQTERMINLWSDELQSQIDAEVRELVNDQFTKAHEIILANKDIVKNIAEELIVQKTLNEQDLTVKLQDARLPTQYNANVAREGSRL